MRFRKKDDPSVVVGAVQWRRTNIGEVRAMFPKRNTYITEMPDDVGPVSPVEEGDWVICTADGFADYIKPDTFAATYEPVPD